MEIYPLKGFVIFWTYILISFIIVMSVIIGRLCPSPKNEFYSGVDTCLFASHSESVVENPQFQSERIKYLTNLLTQSTIINESIVSANTNVKMQARSIYALILAALLTVMFTSSIGTKQKIGLLATFVTIIMYGYDVHSDDVIHRYERPGAARALAVNMLYKLDAYHTSMIELDMHRVDSITLAESNNHGWRKFHSAVTPNLEQAIFYACPLILLLIHGIYINKKNLIARPVCISDQ